MPLLGVLLLLAIPALTSASEKEIGRVADEVSRLNLGFGSYILGQTLTVDQKEKARQALIEKSLKGTYKFKEQWGAEPTPLHWQYISLNGRSMDDAPVEQSKFRTLSGLWRKMPVPISRVLGPVIRKHIGL